MNAKARGRPGGVVLKGAPFAPFIRTAAPSLVGAQPTDTIARAELVALLAAHVPRSSTDDETTVRRRISTRLSDAQEKCTLCPIASKVYLLGVALEWAHAKWPNSLGTLLRFPRSDSYDAPNTVDAMDEVRDRTVPGDLARCQAQIRSMDDKICALNTELADEREQVRSLAPKAAKWDDWNRKKGRKPK